MKLVRIICKTHELKYFQNMVITIENKVSRCCNCYKRGLQQIFENTKEEEFCYIVNTTTVPTASSSKFSWMHKTSGKKRKQCFC